MSDSKLNFIRPTQLNNARILSWFSYKNQEYEAENCSILGLNIGFNSNDSQANILQNLDRLLFEVGINKKKLALARQVHGTNIEVVTNGGMYDSTDGFVATTPGMALGIQVADCGAVLLGDFEHKIIGACHAGWRGAVAGIVPKTLAKMRGLGAKNSSIHVYVSPCLAAHNFEVGEEVANQFPEEWVDRVSNEKPHVNLTGLIQSQLIKEGITTDQIDIDGRCTIDHESLFYSYRREKDKSGRMLGLISLNEV